MTDWILWFAAAGALVILELFSGTFYLLMLALGLGAGAILAIAGVQRPAQMISAAVIGVVATYALRNSRQGKQTKSDAALDPIVNLDFGQTLHIQNWKAADKDSLAM